VEVADEKVSEATTCAFSGTVSMARRRRAHELRWGIERSAMQWAGQVRPLAYLGRE
jgi:hypothetical protein